MGHADLTIKGISLNFTAQQIINYDSLKHIIFNEPDKVLNCDQLLFARKKSDWTLNSRIVKKDYRLVFDKRVINKQTLVSYPYGY